MKMWEMSSSLVTHKKIILLFPSNDILGIDSYCAVSYTPRNGFVCKLRMNKNNFIP